MTEEIKEAFQSGAAEGYEHGYEAGKAQGRREAEEIVRDVLTFPRQCRSCEAAEDREEILRRLKADEETNDG
jgi:flagellar biosynthesis/type III secretory pathway protein FliH